MKVEASLSNSAGGAWPIVALAMYTEVGRFPRLYARLDAGDPVDDGPLKLTLARASNDNAALAVLSSTVWYARERRFAPASGQSWITLSPDTGADMQLRPFAVNGQSASAVLVPRMDASKLSWFDDHELGEPKEVDTLVSMGETFEQLARRVARTTGAAFRLTPRVDDGWTMAWGDSLRSLGPKVAGPVEDGVHALNRVTMPMESRLQRITIPRDYDASLRRTPEGRHVMSIPRWYQMGASGADAIQEASPLTERGAQLPALRAHWYSFSEIATLHDLWSGASIRDPGFDEEDSIPLGTLFFFDGRSVGSQVRHVAEALSISLGGCGVSVDDAQGWCAFALAVPVDAIPAEKALLERILVETRFRSIAERLVEHMGFGPQNLEVAPPPAWGLVPAIVSSNPAASEHGSVTRSDDGMRYRTRIWVRILGTDEDVEVDWGTPFASHDNRATGGGSGGDLILVPEVNSLGYVAFLGERGAPLFLTMTHYRSGLASEQIDPTRYRHALVVEGGLRLQETEANILLQTQDLLTLRAAQLRRQLGRQDEAAFGAPI